MQDPACDIDDFRQDAALAMLENRLTTRGISTAIKNAVRTSHRKMTCHNSHREKIFEFQKKHRETQGKRNTLEELIRSEEAATVMKVLYLEDPSLLSIILMRILNMSTSTMTEATGLSAPTISRAPSRARSVLERKRHQTKDAELGY